MISHGRLVAGVQGPHLRDTDPGGLAAAVAMSSRSCRCGRVEARLGIQRSRNGSMKYGTVQSLAYDGNPPNAWTVPKRQKIS